MVLFPNLIRACAGHVRAQLHGTHQMSLPDITQLRTSIVPHQNNVCRPAWSLLQSRNIVERKLMQKMSPLRHWGQKESGPLLQTRTIIEHQRMKNRLKAQLLDDVKESLIISHPLKKLAVQVALCSSHLMTKLGSITWHPCLLPITQAQLNLSDVTKDLLLLLMIQDRERHFRYLLNLL